MQNTGIADLFFGKPWAIHEEYVPVLTNIVERHVNGEKLTSDQIEMATEKNKKDRNEYSVVDGNAIIPVYGVISKRMTWLSRISGGTSTQILKKQIDAAINDSQINSIILDIDSPGGSSDGVPEIADYIFEAREKKQIIAFCDGMAASAAYFIAAAANKVYATKSTDVGSIGVYAVVYDATVRNHQAGLNVEVIKAGKYKATGHPAKPITSDDRMIIQSKVDEIYDLFKDSVKKYRSMSDDAIAEVATGRTWIASKALGNKLIDGIGDIENYINKASATGGRMSGKKRLFVGDNINNKQTEVNKMDWNELSLEDIQQNRPDLADKLKSQGHAAGYKEGKDAGIIAGHESGKKDGQKEGMTEGAKQGVSQERTRVKAIFASGDSVPGSEKIVRDCIVSGDSDEEAGKKISEAKLDQLSSGTASHPGPNSQSDSGGDGETHMDLALKYKEANNCSLGEALSATAPKRVSTLV